MEYWKECVSESLSDVGIAATDEQIELIAESIEGAHENFGMATGLCVADENFISDDKIELDRLKKDAEDRRIWEAQTEPCSHCITNGIVSDLWGRDIKCYRCDGSGRVNRA